MPVYQRRANWTWTRSRQLPDPVQKVPDPVQNFLDLAGVVEVLAKYCQSECEFFGPCGRAWSGQTAKQIGNRPEDPGTSSKGRSREILGQEKIWFRDT